MREFEILVPRPHAKQQAIADDTHKRKVIRAGRRSGKTVLMGILAVQAFLAGKRVLYATPTSDQLGRFWSVVCQALDQPIRAGVLKKNESEHFIELPGTEIRIRAKTAWNADTLRGDYADLLILDEFQLMNEDTWGLVGAPMLLDNNGDAIFCYTPPSLHTRSVTKADDPQHAAKMFKRAKLDTTGRWVTFHFSSHDNPYISSEALGEVTHDMTALAYRMEIMAEDVDEAPGALWTRATLEKTRVHTAPTTEIVLHGQTVTVPALERIVVAIDPSATSGGDAAGIVVAGIQGDHFYTLADYTLQGSPLTWANAAVQAYYYHQADLIVAESNNGGEMVSTTIQTVDAGVPVKLVTASRGKQTRAEPVAAIFEQGRGHLVGQYPALEDEMCIWIPGDPSPNRMDALVWAITELNVAPITLGVID